MVITLAEFGLINYSSSYINTFFKLFRIMCVCVCFTVYYYGPKDSIT